MNNIDPNGMSEEPSFLEVVYNGIKGKIGDFVSAITRDDPAESNEVDPTGVQSGFSGYVQEYMERCNQISEACEFFDRTGAVSIYRGAVTGDEGKIVGGVVTAGLLGVGSVAKGKAAIGYAEGLGESAFTPDRMQHASRHLIDAGLLPSKGADVLLKQIGSKILENPLKTAGYLLRDGNAGKAFLGKYKGTYVVIVVYKEGKNATKVATSYVPSARQLALWGIKN
jgi:hypothetical protein